jgi:hypothetical protein
LIFRAWTYFRTGYSTYISFPLGFISTVIVVYSLGIKPVIDNPSGGTLTNIFLFLFPHLSNFILIGAAVLIPLCIISGLLHFNRTGPYSADASVSTEQNPYVYRVIPGKEEEVFVPLWMFTAKALGKMLDKQENMSTEEKKQFEEALEKAEKLLTGKPVGIPERPERRFR